jgi:GntR family transcriptional regulator, rspAB operon transcriptional repressor
MSGRAVGDGTGLRAAATLFPRGRSKSAVVHEHLRSEIIRLQRPPGSRVEKAEICERLSVSRHPVADAIARLAEERLVDVLPQSGTFVARIRIADVDEAAFVRRAIEAAAVRQIAPGSGEELLGELTRITSYQAVAGDINDVAEFFQLDLRFHSVMMAQLGNRRAADILDAAWAPLERARRMLLPNPARNEETLAEHRGIIAALASRDPDRAASAMRTHLDKAMDAFHRVAAERPELFEP